MKTVAEYECERLTRVLNSIKRRRLSGTAAFEINALLDAPAKYQPESRLSDDDAAILTQWAESQKNNGIVPAETLLTEYQQAAQKKRVRP